MTAELVTFLEKLTLSQGHLAGQKLTVLPWQKRFLKRAFADGVFTGALSVGRGNGKTALLAGVAVATLIGPLARLRSETIIVASSLTQARFAFEHCMAFMKGVIKREPRRWKIADSLQAARLEDRETGCRVRCVSSDPRKSHGASPTLALLDEPAQWPENTGEKMLAAIRTSLGKVPGSRLIALGTRSAHADHWFERMLQGGADYSQVHAARPDDPPFQRRTWKRANPSLDHMPDLAKAIAHEARQARSDPALLAAFRALRLNQGVSDTVVNELISAGTWAACEGDAEKLGSPVWGIDLGTSAAQSAVAAYWPESGRLECFAAFPCEPSLAERGLRDGVGRLYVTCEQRGELIQTGQNAVDVSALLVEALQRFGRPSLIVSDRWREAELRDALTAAGVPVATLELRGMGFRDGAQDVREFRRATLEGKVTPVPSVLLASALKEARTISDPAGNAKLSKGSQGGRRLRARDDAAAAAILAIATGVRRPAKPRRAWRYVGMVG